jgi:glutamate synthase domain-containing protein 3
VRNSGAVAVVEGVGDHACEYMTNGVVVVLGDFGRNLGAAMSGGEAYVYDPGGLLSSRLNGELVEARPLAGGGGELRALLERHWRHTGSRRAERLLESWADAVRSFRHVVPKAEAARLEEEHEGTIAGSPAGQLSEAAGA